MLHLPLLRNPALYCSLEGPRHAHYVCDRVSLLVARCPFRVNTQLFFEKRDLEEVSFLLLKFSLTLNTRTVCQQ